MSTKEWVYFEEEGASLYQELNFDTGTINENPACIYLKNPDDFYISKESFRGNTSFVMTVDIPAERMDELAIAWCKKRNLNTNEYTLDELLSKGNFKWPVSEEELIEGLEEAADDIELASLVRRREGQPEVEGELEYDNIFDVLTSDKEKAAQLKKLSDEVINQRDVSELKGISGGHNNKVAGAAKGILKHIRANQTIDDEESLLTALEQQLEEVIDSLQITNHKLESDDQNSRD